MAGTKGTVARKRNNEKNVAPEDFIKAVKSVHASGGKIADIARQLNLEVGSVNARMYTMRKAGVNLPQFPRGGGGKGLDVQALNAILAQ